MSLNGAYAAIAIDNKRNEDCNGGQIPQLPAGFLVIVGTLKDDVAAWRMRSSKSKQAYASNRGVKLSRKMLLGGKYGSESFKILHCPKGNSCRLFLPCICQRRTI